MVSKAMIQLYEMQGWLRRVAEIMGQEAGHGDVQLRDKCEAVKAMSAAVEAWEKLEERKRIMKGRPLPGTLKHVELKRRKVLSLDDISREVEVESEEERKMLTEASGGE